MKKNISLLSRFYSKSIRRPFTEREDEQLKKLVAEFGDDDWKLIAEQLGSRTPRQCRERYKNYLMPGIVNGPWTKEEDALLYSKYHEIGPHWSLIGKAFPTRSEVNIKNRWASISKPNRKKSTEKIHFDETSQQDEMKDLGQSKSEERLLRKSARQRNVSKLNKDSENHTQKNRAKGDKSEYSTESSPVKASDKNQDDKEQEALFRALDQEIFHFDFDSNSAFSIGAPNIYF
ncbi:Myb-like DNA-binding domain containing protein [Tritrichomonas foetus]|uniref:Myb-like DNA-binding domain containing protein n=1 Tax=Tritrichomonas foetus TaxID=1144522 RepID=A0A1J4KJW8_9EUKA|nr:Myb-like DNA-binding domain containing protein [Tritrichomonas foetus]|eukprot:OHT11601.1 Myb-like DNA-binding domain containing protein [Tritrichomonas foetus]